jgi:NAD(P)-dependent dehydrogenase (short-subunit alcohol dehydrogenase family)
VLISGAGSGLGRAIASRLSDGGAHSIVADIDLDSAEQTVKLIRDTGGQASAILLDVTDPASARSANASTAWSTMPEPTVALGCSISLTSSGSR